ncbi:MAG: hypothetical protein ACE5O2_04105 [Armatimonadota bacterium]
MNPFNSAGLGVLCRLLVAPVCAQADAPGAGGGAQMIEFENAYVKYVVGADGKNLRFVDKRDAKDYCQTEPPAPIARVTMAGETHEASAATYANGRLRITFGDSEAAAVLAVRRRRHYFLFEVLRVEGEDVESLEFAVLHTTLKAAPDEPFALCALALNLKTNVRPLPQPLSKVSALCYSRFGIEGAAVALIGCPRTALRDVLKEVVTQARDLPKSPIGGPWAMDADINRASYLFITPSEANVDEVIRTVESVGFNQVEIHGGRGTYRFGDCQPNRKLYPNGVAGIKATIAKLHDAGIYVGMHPYAFFIDKTCPWVTPVPDKRLAKDATFTLAEELAADATTVPVVESTRDMSNITGFFVRNSVTLHVDDELITYKDVSKQPPYAFTNCTRGAYGTRAARHAAGAKVHHLKECFGLFVPDPETSLFDEVAAKNAEFFNECDFDTIYLDALDGSDVLGGRENAWHYGSKYVWELWKRLKKPAAMEYSTFHHHLWVLRSRHGAWDHSTRCHKHFIDVHVRANKNNERMFLPSNLGWWAFKPWQPPQVERTFPDDIEYWCAKALGTDSGLSLQGYNPALPEHQRLAAIVRQYEELRHAKYFPEHIKEKLRAPGEEFTLTRGADGKWAFAPVQYARHKVSHIDGWSNVWQTHNKFARQPAGIRIEALMAAGPYEAEGNVTLASFTDPEEFPSRAAAPGITARLQLVQPEAGAEPGHARITASSTASARRGAWARMGKTFSPILDLRKHQALGVWVRGDGNGELLNFQIESPDHISRAKGEHYVLVDFQGWRYFELIEPDAGDFAKYSWPYGGLYSIYREFVRYNAVESLTLWCNNLPPNDTATCELRPVKALPLVNTKLINPSLTVGENTVTFPTEIESGSWLEFRSMSDCRLYGPQGQLIREVIPQGQPPVLERGDNPVRFTCEAPAGVSARANVTLITHGEPLQ